MISDTLKIQACDLFLALASDLSHEKLLKFCTFTSEL